MRCNCGINPKNLTDEHLFAESRELKMLPSLYEKVGDNSINKVPKEFTLGKGHMLFFLYKPAYTWHRYDNVLFECYKRGFNVKNEYYRWDVYQKSKCLHEMPESRKSKPRSLKSYDFQDCHIDATPSIWQFFVIMDIRGRYVYSKEYRSG